MDVDRRSWPVFLIGCHRSGTTLARFILDSHPEITCPPETKFLAGLYEFTNYPQVSLALFSLGLKPCDVLAEIGVFSRHLLDAYAARQRKRRWVDKTPNYYRILPFIDDIFGRNVLYLFIVRHPLDTVASLGEFFQLAGPNFDDPEIERAIRQYGAGHQCWARYWLEVYDAIDIFAAAHRERVHVFRYEDLVNSGATVMKDVFNFIGEEFSEDLLTSAFQCDHGQGYGDPDIRSSKGIHEKSVGRWKSWDRAQAESIWRIVEPRALRFGYSISGEAD